MNESINIEGLDKAELLAALYNGSRAQGLGLLHFTPDAMTAEEARATLAKQDYFDYHKGRVMKISLAAEAKTLDQWGYDRDNGQGSVQRIVDSLRAKA